MTFMEVIREQIIHYLIYLIIIIVPCKKKPHVQALLRSFMEYSNGAMADAKKEFLEVHR